MVLYGCAALGPGVERDARVSAEAACSAPAAVQPGDDGSEAEPGVSALLGYARRVRAQPEAVQRREVQRAEQALARRHGAAERLRLGLLLLLPETGLRDISRARRLLQQAAKNGASAEQQGLSEVLLVLLNERDAQERARWSIAQQWEDEQRRHKTLQRQLEALKAIEETIIERKRPEGLRLDDVDPTENPLDLTRFCGHFTVHNWRVLYVEV